MERKENKGTHEMMFIKKKQKNNKQQPDFKPLLHCLSVGQFISLALSIHISKRKQDFEVGEDDSSVL